jgi:dipeptidyl aminopeptidase/acylaminoacyl peptidase
VFLSALALAAVLQAAPTIHSYMGLTLSPRGDRMAAFEGTGGMAGHSVVTLRDLSGKVTATYDPCKTCRYDAPAWSPDGGKLAFLANDMTAGTTALYVVADNQPRLLTTITGVANRPLWSPDGRTIAFLAVIGAHKRTGATQPGAHLVGEIGAAAATDEQRIVTLPAAGGDISFVSPADTWVYEYEWTPDGKGFVATAAKGDGDDNWWTARLEAFAPGSERVIAAPKMQMNMPTVSADGKTVYVIGGLMSDFGPIGGDVYAVPYDSGKTEDGGPVDLTPGYKGTFTSLKMTSGGLIAGMNINGETDIGRVGAQGGVTLLAKGGDSNISQFSVDAAGRTAVAVSDSFTQAPRILAGSLTDLAPVTHDNDAVTSPFKATNITWTNEGFTVEGWLLAPLHVEPGKTYPMVTIVHGGPAAAVTPRFAAAGTAVDLLKAGYFVFEPNPRGSYGQGEAFTQANRRDFGGGDLRDILAGIDAVEKAAPVDDKRLGITGVSYGGLMTMWAVTQTNRFKAAAAGAGIANWSSYYGENGIDQWMIPYFGASYYDDPAIYDKLSPIRYIKNARTPTFIFVGERDVECPAPQSQEFWHGLKDMGVPTTLMIYEGEGHGIRQPEHVRDLTARTLAWFDKYLK